jgi:membrane protein
MNFLSFSLWRDALKTWSHAEADQYSAAVAYFTPFALTPLIFISIAWVGLMIGSEELTVLLSGWGSVIDPALPDLFKSSLLQFSEIANQFSVPFIAIMFFSIMVPVALNSVTAGLHAIWGLEYSGVRALAMRYVRAISFVFLLQAYLVFIILLSRLIDSLITITTIQSLIYLNPLLVFSSTVVLVALGYGVLPLWAPSFRSCVVGAIVATSFLMIARAIVAFHFATAPAATLFGAATVIIVLLVWFYVGASVILFGAAFAKVYDAQLRHRNN